MSRKFFAFNCGVAAALIALVVPANAHHSLTAEFDTSRTVEISGTITEMKWTNPHAWLYVDVEDTNGLMQNYAVEFGSPNQLYRRGWHKGDLPQGATIKVVGYPPRDNSLRVSATDVTLPDGRTLFGGTRQAEQN
jgi:Family of unknown function (DUF6152)